MDEKAHSFSHFYNQPQSPKIYLPKPAGSTSSGLTLVIPSLKSLKASQTASKPKQRSVSIHPPSPAVFQDAEVQEKKIPRPVKLKPLKEVLSKLIFQLKKKDDYAFFLHPVDVANVPGYSDVVKRPMDLGTMSDKVNKGKYRSLEEFASDFRLVTNNAKMFNPPGTIYHTEADRLEVWGLDHISKASSTVIQYETDWNIEIEKDDDGPNVNVDEEEEESVEPATMDVDGTSLRERSGSVVSQIPQGPSSSSRRGPRGPYKKNGQNGQSNTLSETLEPDGGLPGSKDGLGSFPAGSDWAKTMVALKLKGKRYKTKKERLRIEREGPPLLPDGSLDYTEMEDPFSVLSFFVPDPPSRPHVVPLYQPFYNASPLPQTQAQIVSDPSSSNTPQPPPTGISTPLPPPTFPSATSVPLDHPPLTLPFLQQPPKSQSQQQKQNDGSGKQPSQPQMPQRRHWTIVRNPTSRQKGKEKEDEQEMTDVPAWQMPREPHAVDYGSFSVLAGALAEEMQRRQTMGTAGGSNFPFPSSSSSSPFSGGGGGSSVGVGMPAVNEKTDQEMTFALIRESLDCEKAAKRLNNVDEGTGGTTAHAQANGNNSITSGYWTTKRAAEGEEYVRDLVYGGLDGLAYVRSLAEFVDGNTYYKNEDSDDADGEGTAETNDESMPASERPSYNPHLGMKLAKWVELNIVDPLTEGRHSLLKETGIEIVRQQLSKNANAASQYQHLHPGLDPRQGTVASQVAASLHLYPAALVALSSLLHIKMHKIDMGSLIKTPNELFLSEEEWIGKTFKEKRRKAKLAAEAEAKTEPLTAGTEDAMEVEEPEQTWAGVDASLVKDRVNGRLPAYEQEGPEELREVLEYVADVIVELDKRTRLEKSTQSALKSAATATADPMKMDEDGAPLPPPPPPPTPEEDPTIRNLRLNLLALAKRAPLDTIARLPKDLVPEHIRHFVPTLGSTG